MTVTTFVSYAAGDPILASAALRLAGRITTTHLRPTVPPLPDHPHPAVGRVLAVDRVGTLVVDPAGRWLASAGYRVPVRIWDPTKGAEIFELPGSEGSETLAVSPDGQFLASQECAGSLGKKAWWSCPGEADTGF
jgi:WD40 repeat protein